MRTFETLDVLVKQIETGFFSVHSDSRKVKVGDVFVAIPGSSLNGADFIPDVLERGAAWVVCRKEDMPPEGTETAESNNGEATFVLVEDPKEALGIIAGGKFGTKELTFPVVGVTGTNGKTTITYLLEHLFTSAGRRTGVIGTVSYRWPGAELEASMTTPDCLKLHSLLSRMAAADVDAVFMEVSSHALDQNRTAGIRFGGAVLTNITQDHLDYHGTMEAYFDAKARLFRDMEDTDKPLAINVDDAWGRKLLAEVSNGLGYSLQGVTVDGARVLQGTLLNSSVDGMTLRMELDGSTWELTTPMVGAHNASNLLAVQAIGLGLGLTPHDMQGLAGFNGVCGRLERVPNTKGIHVFVDYAHTPDALENVLSALRATGFKRILTVFGCGGDRDRTKRPLMGAAVCKFTDVAVLTSDNPRHEDPVSIMEDVKAGLSACKELYENPDRRGALELAVNIAKPGDCILVAGKGHEDYQQVGDEKLPFSDQQILQEILA